METENFYLKAFGKLNRATKNNIKAPHKVILLLAVLNSISEGEIQENKIRITPQLVARFKDYWSWLVKESFFKPNFYLPFYHLQSEKFWHLKTVFGKEILLTKSFSIGSFNQLKETVEYAYFDDALFNLLQSNAERNRFYHFLLQHYFGILTLYKQPSLFEEVTQQVLNDSPEIYQQFIEQADEEEVFIRSGVFKRVVPQIYKYTCCITGLRIISEYDIQMVDACHIVPFSNSHNDTITNGISLCPNLHRAFDRGLIGIDSEYRVIVSESFIESESESSIKRFHTKPILLPEKERYYPSLENLNWHRLNKFRQ